MPELPEVETTRRGISPHVIDRTVREVRVHNPRLRRRVPGRLRGELTGQRIVGVDRRSKYLLLNATAGWVIIHLGMSGSLRVVGESAPLSPYDHVEFVFDNDSALRLRDPRRFGSVLWTRRSPARHPLLVGLGPEPLSAGLTGDYLRQRARGRRTAVKHFIMDGRIVCGVGNIYASEALFTCGIDPRRAAGRTSLRRYRALAAAIKETLERAIAAGGTTLKDFTREDGKPGYFRHQLQVYGRDGLPCVRCGSAIRKTIIGQRSSYYCTVCQR